MLVARSTGHSKPEAPLEKLRENFAESELIESASPRRGECSMADVSREVRLAARPVGLPREQDFEIAEVPVPDPGPEQVEVRNIYMSVDPYMRGRMNDVRSYTPPFAIGEPLNGGAIGQVVRSNHASLREGDFVQNQMGWRERFVADGAGFRKIERGPVPLSAYLGALGGPGFTAYVGLLDLGQPKEGETVFVSGAAGAVGTVVGQIAKIKGCRAIGSAGSDEKVSVLRDELGFDGAFNYKTADLGRALKELAPRGIDIYFDNVGGAQLEAALNRMNVHGRIPVCGMISLYNATELPAGPPNLIQLIPKRLTLRGFILSDHVDRLPAFLEDMTKWLEEGQVRMKETIVEGIDAAPRAFLGMLQGENVGKMLVRLAPEPR
jgi:NADPH-dependent curcumin reductase CurA